MCIVELKEAVMFAKPSLDASARRSPLPRFETNDRERGGTRSYAGRPVQSPLTAHVVAAISPEVLIPHSQSTRL